ncbi:outer membrane lipoprotein carrier protein LolA [uncultured Flavobacterium sp.]|uniref:LolA family protein n=1 Tax=uncultured Flavobacterium sp. TaxID=165435 RepID=UPI0030CA1377
MKYFIKVALIFLLTLSTQAQESKKAKQLLDEVAAKAKGYTNIIIDFKYDLSNAKENINQESKGKVAIQSLQSNKYVLDFMGITKMFDGKKTYTIVPEDEEISISKGQEDEKAISPDKMLTFFETGYTYLWDISQNIKGRKIQYIKLKPTNTKENIKEVLIGIDVSTNNIYNMIETDKKGTKTTLTVNSFKTNQPLSKNHFTFTESKYPGYYINSLD